MSKSGKIVFKLREFPHLSETFIVAQIVTAINLGYEVRILVQKLIESDLELRSSLIAEYGLLDKIILEDYKIPKNKLVRLFKWTKLLIINSKDFFLIRNYYKEQTKFSLTWLFQWSFYNQFKETDIFHVQYGTNSNPLSVLKKVGFKPALIVTFHGHDAFFPINSFIPQEGYYDNLFNYADLITANTPYLGNQILKLGCPSNLLKLIPVGVDTDFFYAQKTKKSNRTVLKLINVGRLDKFKGQINCIKVVELLVNKGIDVFLTIVGEGNQRKFLESFISESQLQEKVCLLGKRSQFEIRKILWSQDLYLHTGIPSINGLRESQGLATLEAQACGLPVVVCDSGGVKYTVEDGVSGFVCKESDIEEVIQKIEFLYNNQNLIDVMGEKAVTFVNNEYSQKTIDKRWGYIYSKMMCND